MAYMAKINEIRANKETMNHMMPWTAENDYTVLEQSKLGTGAEDIAKILLRTVGSIQARQLHIAAKMVGGEKSVDAVAGELHLDIDVLKKHVDKIAGQKEKAVKNVKEKKKEIKAQVDAVEVPKVANTTVAQNNPVITSADVAELLNIMRDIRDSLNVIANK